jgi:hypothetical protein
MKWARRSMPPTVWPHHDRTTNKEDFEQSTSGHLF